MSFISIAESIGEGIVSVPETLLDGVIRTGQGLAFWNTEEEVKIGGQNTRAYAVLKTTLRYGFEGAKSPIPEAIAIILQDYYDSLPEVEKKKIISAAVDKGFFVIGKIMTSMTLSEFVGKRVTANIARKAVIKNLLKFTASAEFNLLAMQGLLYKAGAAIPCAVTN